MSACLPVRPSPSVLERHTGSRLDSNWWLGWVVLVWVGLGWIGLDWTGLDWIGSDRIGSGHSVTRSVVIIFDQQTGRQTDRQTERRRQIDRQTGRQRNGA